MTKETGVPEELEDGERCVPFDFHATVLPSGVEFQVLVERGVGAFANFCDARFRVSGANLVESTVLVWGADLVVNVKECLASGWHYFRAGSQLFGYLHPVVRSALATSV